MSSFCDKLCTPADSIVLVTLECAISPKLRTTDHRYSIGMVSYIAFNILGRDYVDYYIDAMVYNEERISRRGDSLLSIEGDGVDLILDSHLELQPHHFPIRKYLAPFAWIDTKNSFKSPLPIRVKWRMYPHDVLMDTLNFTHRPVLDEKTGHLYVGGSLLVDASLKEYEKCKDGIYTISESTP